MSMNNKELVILAGKPAGGGGGGGSGLTEAVKQALMDVVNNVGWKNGDGQQYIDELEAALYPLSYITAVYTQSGPVYATDSLDSLKADLVVTAFYQGRDSKIVTDYTLSGALIEGTSTITVSYGGKTATFNVVVTGNLVPDGYVRDGLIFFLDGKQLVDIANGTWTDIVGGKTFALTDCTLGADGVNFNGSSSHGDYQGAISSDWQNETIEAALSEFTAGKAIFAQPSAGANVGISYGISNGSAISAVFGFTGQSENAFQTAGGVNRNKGSISVNHDRMVLRGTKYTYTYTTSWNPCEGGITCIGAKITNGAYASFYGQTIHAIRIYNRKLSQDEMIQNQQADIDRYGL